MQLNEKGTVYLASTESELKKGWLKCICPIEQEFG